MIYTKSSTTITFVQVTVFLGIPQYPANFGPFAFILLPCSNYVALTKLSILSVPLFPYL